MKTIPFMHRIAHGVQKKTLEIGQNLKRFDRFIKDAGSNKAIYPGHPIFEGFTVVL